MNRMRQSRRGQALTERGAGLADGEGDRGGFEYTAGSVASKRRQGFESWYLVLPALQTMRAILYHGSSSVAKRSLTGLSLHGCWYCK